MSTYFNNVAQGVSGTPGTGAITLGSAQSGARTLAAAMTAAGLTAATVDVFITDGSAWAVERNLTTTDTGATLARGATESISSGSGPLSLTSAAVVRVALPASSANNYDRALSAVIPGGRLTLESGVPVSTTDQTAKTSIFYTPFVHNVVPLWNGSEWVPTTFTEVTQALGTITSGRPYDVFGFLNGSSLNTEILAWTNDTTRATAVTLQDGRYCKSGDKTRLLLGSFYTTSTTTTADAATQRLVDNVYNVVKRRGYRQTTSNHAYSSSTRRAWDNAPTTSRIEVMQSVAKSVMVGLSGGVSPNADGRYATISIGVDTHTGTKQFEVFTSTSQEMLPGAAHDVDVGAGFHYLGVMEEVGGSVGSANFVSFWLSADWAM